MSERAARGSARCAHSGARLPRPRITMAEMCAVETAEGGADNVSITHGGLKLVLPQSEVMFLKTILSVVCRRQESSLSWTADNLGVVKAGHLIVSTVAS